ncbi:hypothetical protein LOD99_14371 [Oopsacas minuta]|uniref:Uncharacterized protein n=1 Tax=Oopsacas minuta TaxID=111878 RepID=A0AAV7KGK9_9METZ|nr:hypothetical protein LOD99_14371 [Oopsacas minuta]
MPRMTNANAREKLSSTLKQFRSITGESIGVVFTWRGKLAIMGTENFQNLIHSQKNEFCGSIVGSHRETDCERFNQDKKILDQLDGDLKSYRKNVSFWNDASLVPSFCPRDVEYQNIKHSNKKTMPGSFEVIGGTDDVIVPTTAPSLVSQLGITPLQPIFKYSPILNKKQRSLHCIQSVVDFLLKVDQ